MKHISLLLLLSLVGCGAEVATTAATTAKLKAEEAKQGEQTKQQIQQQIDAAAALQNQQIQQAEKSAQ